MNFASLESSLVSGSVHHACLSALLQTGSRSQCQGISSSGSSQSCSLLLSEEELNSPSHVCALKVLEEDLLGILDMVGNRACCREVIFFEILAWVFFGPFYVSNCPKFFNNLGFI